LQPLFEDYFRILGSLNPRIVDEVDFNGGYLSLAAFLTSRQSVYLLTFGVIGSISPSLLHKSQIY